MKYKSTISKWTLLGLLSSFNLLSFSQIEKKERLVQRFIVETRIQRIVKGSRGRSRQALNSNNNLIKIRKHDNLNPNSNLLPLQSSPKLILQRNIILFSLKDHLQNKSNNNSLSLRLLPIIITWEYKLKVLKCRKCSATY
jgi:hypothetical protein